MYIIGAQRLWYSTVVSQQLVQVTVFQTTRCPDWNTMVNARMLVNRIETEPVKNQTNRASNKAQRRLRDQRVSRVEFMHK